MSNPAFTPGPWRVQVAPLRASIYADINVPNGGNIVCDAPMLEASREHWPANAILIAAAPELYAALENIARQKTHKELRTEGLINENESADFEGAYDMMIETARAAMERIEK